MSYGRGAPKNCLLHIYSLLLALVFGMIDNSISNVRKPHHPNVATPQPSDVTNNFIRVGASVQMERDGLRKPATGERRIPLTMRFGFPWDLSQKRQNRTSSRDVYAKARRRSLLCYHAWNVRVSC
eukprot:6180534-Pleurochrysis_carterae.AAC.1